MPQQNLLDNPFLLLALIAVVLVVVGVVVVRGVKKLLSAQHSPGAHHDGSAT